jgi:hypothetical protein
LDDKYEANPINQLPVIHESSRWACCWICFLTRRHEEHEGHEDKAIFESVFPKSRARRKRLPWVHGDYRQGNRFLRARLLGQILIQYKNMSCQSFFVTFVLFVLNE